MRPLELQLLVLGRHLTASAVPVGLSANQLEFPLAAVSAWPFMRSAVPHRFDPMAMQAAMQAGLWQDFGHKAEEADQSMVANLSLDIRGFAAA